MEKHKQQILQKKSNAKCDYCGITLSDSEILSEHIKLHQNRPDFQCLQCEFTGKTNNQLKTHMRIHVSNLLPNDLNSNSYIISSLFAPSVHDVNVDQTATISVRIMWQSILWLEFVPFALEVSQQRLKCGMLHLQNEDNISGPNASAYASACELKNLQ